MVPRATTSPATPFDATTELPALGAVLASLRARADATADDADRALLEAARVGETQLAERATGYYWGEPRLRAHVEAMLAEAERAGDERLETVARRFLR
jgi:hypothetical protein